MVLAAVLLVALLSGVGTGYMLSANSGSSKALPGSAQNPGTPKQAAQDSRTFRDFAEGVVQKKPAPKDGNYSEGTHLLTRQNAVPVALTSSVLDLTQYEGKKVKVYGETQKAIKEGWLMDVGRVEVE